MTRDGHTLSLWSRPIGPGERICLVGMFQIPDCFHALLQLPVGEDIEGIFVQNLFSVFAGSHAANHLIAAGISLHPNGGHYSISNGRNPIFVQEHAPCAGRRPNSP
jgi:hypothetical protein